MTSPTNGLPAAAGVPTCVRAGLCALALAIVLFPLAVSAQPTSDDTAAAPTEANGGPAKVEIPPEDWGAQLLDVLEFAQLQTRERFGVVHDFGFEDKLEASGITFRHYIVDDAGKDYKPVHYDHGNGIAAADVDGDGHLDLYFTTQLGANELWRNRGDGTFEDVTEKAGVALADKVSVSASFGDVDGDGDPDLYVTTVRMGNHLFTNDGTGRFTDVTAKAGVGYSGHSSGAMFFDYDLDGDLDLFLTNVGTYTSDEQGRGDYYVGLQGAFFGHIKPERTETSILYRNRGDGRFDDVSAEVLADGSWSGDAAFADLNGDRYPDLYVLNMQGDDHYYENQGGRRFVDKTEELFPKTPWGTMGVKFFDYDNDGRLDLILTDMHSDMPREVTPGLEKLKSVGRFPEHFLQGGENNIFGNALYHNLGDGRFEEVSDPMGAENYWPWGVSVDDLNADGFEDVFIASSMNYPFRYGINTVLLNDRGEIFRDSEFLLGIEPRKGPLKKHWFDLDCADGDREHMHCKEQEGAVTVTASVGTRSTVMLDLDGDGDLDIVTNEFNDVPQVLVSDLADERAIHWLKVELEGTESNRDGLGARVTVHAGGKTYTKVNDGKSGYLSQSSMPLYFGLGEATGVEKIEVEWPSGRTQTVTGVEINSTRKIVEG